MHFVKEMTKKRTAEGIYQKAVLDNGIRIVTEKIPYLRSVSIGIWINSGSRDEDDINSGISHFLEHLAFKGTVKRSAKQIAFEVDSIGGQIDAFTSREYTCYSAKVLDEHPLGRSILGNVESIKKIGRDEVIAHLDKHYLPRNMIIAAAGNIDEDKLRK